MLWIVESAELIFLASLPRLYEVIFAFETLALEKEKTEPLIKIMCDFTVKWMGLKMKCYLTKSLNFQRFYFDGFYCNVYLICFVTMTTMEEHVFDFQPD